jgi:hypothetical protein
MSREISPMMLFKLKEIPDIKCVVSFHYFLNKLHVVIATSNTSEEEK